MRGVLSHGGAVEGSAAAHRSVATTCLLFVLASLYPQYTIVFQGLVALDIISHWMHMYRYIDTDARLRRRGAQVGTWRSEADRTR